MQVTAFPVHLQILNMNKKTKKSGRTPRAAIFIRSRNLANMIETGWFAADRTGYRAVVAAWCSTDMALRGMFETEVNLARPAFCMTMHANYAATA